MSARIDPVAGRAFLRDRSLFVCSLLPPDPGHPERWTALALAAGPGTSAEEIEEAVDLARALGGRHYAMVVERVALGTDDWPSTEPIQLASYVVERGGFVLLAPSIEGWVSIPPRQPHHVVRLVAVEPAAGEQAARSALAALGTCGLLGRVRAVVHGDSGAEIDAVVCGPGGLRGGYFPREESPEVPESGRGEAPPPASARSASQGPVDGSILNAALAAYLRPFPREQELLAFLQQHGLEHERLAVQNLLDAILQSADEHLWAQQPGVRWSEAFEASLFQHLHERHAWLTPAAFATVLAYARWLCWHEGLDS